MWEVQCFLRQQHHRPAAAAIISAFWNNRCGQTLEYSAWSVKINWHKVPLIWRGDAKYDREMQLALDQSERKLQCWHPPWSRVIMWFMSSSCTAMNTQYHEASEYLPHMAGVLSAQGAIFTFPIQLFSWLACSVTRPLQSPVSGLRLVQTYLPPLSPSQSRLETQLSQSRVFPPHSLSSQTLSVKDRAEFQRNRLLSSLSQFCEFSHLIACSEEPAAAHCRLAPTHCCRMRSAVPSPLQCTCYHWNIARTLDRGVLCHNTYTNRVDNNDECTLTWYH